MNNVIPVLAIPQLNRKDLLLRCLKSIDHPVDRLVIVQNGNDNEMLTPLQWVSIRAERSIGSVIIIKHPNAGCAGSWNEVIKLFPAAFWIFSANDIAFAAGDLEKMANAAIDHAHEFTHLFGNHGHGFFCVTKRGVEKLGLYDENIHPAYLEDCDMMTRCRLAGEKFMDVPGIAAIHGDGRLTGSCTINSDPKFATANGRTHGGNFQYYVRKWGGVNEKETFTTPFNDPHWPLWSWKFEPETRARQQW